MVVVNKPAGMVVHPAAGHDSGTLVNALLHHITDLSGVGGERRPGIVHRLDKGTSGVMVVAKHDAAHQELARQFHDREVEKEYVALVWGLVQQRKRIDIPIGRDPVHREKISTRARRARSAVTRVTWAQHVPGLSLLRVVIATGRTHQIRVHLNAIGHPIVGDALYGGVHRRVPHELRAVQRLDAPVSSRRAIGVRAAAERRAADLQRAAAPGSADRCSKRSNRSCSRNSTAGSPRMTKQHSTTESRKTIYQGRIFALEVDRVTTAIGSHRRDGDRAPSGLGGASADAGRPIR